MKPVTVRLSDLLAVIVAIVALTAAGVIWMYRTNKADRAYRETLARESLITIFQAEHKAKRDGLPCYQGLAALVSKERLRVSDRLGGFLVNGYTIVVTIPPTCDSFRGFAYPDEPHGFNRTGDRSFVITHDGKLYTFEALSGQLLKTERIKIEAEL